MLLQRNLIYTGITRGKKLVVLIGQKKALGIADHNDRPQRRYSGLLASLRSEGWQTITATAPAPVEKNTITLKQPNAYLTGAAPRSNLKTAYFGGLRDGLGGAGIRTLACSKNRREDLERQGWV
jgi:hypothetical protein